MGSASKALPPSISITALGNIMATFIAWPSSIDHDATFYHRTAKIAMPCLSHPDASFGIIHSSHSPQYFACAHVPCMLAYCVTCVLRSHFQISGAFICIANLKGHEHTAIIYITLYQYLNDFHYYTYYRPYVYVASVLAIFFYVDPTL